VELTYGYTKMGAVDTLRYARIGVEVAQHYNRRKQPDTLVARRSGTEFFQQILAYDPKGEIVGQRWQHTYSGVQSLLYHYDGAGRMDMWSDWSGSPQTTAYNYDSVGNRQLTGKVLTGEYDQYYSQRGRTG